MQRNSLWPAAAAPRTRREAARRGRRTRERQFIRARRCASAWRRSSSTGRAKGSAAHDGERERWPAPSLATRSTSTSSIPAHCRSRGSSRAATASVHHAICSDGPSWRAATRTLPELRRGGRRRSRAAAGTRAPARERARCVGHGRPAWTVNGIRSMDRARGRSSSLWIGVLGHPNWRRKSTCHRDRNGGGRRSAAPGRPSASAAARRVRLFHSHSPAATGGVGLARRDRRS